MTGDLYDTDILIWSDRQAALLRRLARGERVNDVDWEHVAEEIEDLGRSELHAVESFLDLILTHLLKLAGWPGNAACQHWRREIATFQRDARRRLAPSMRQRIDLAAIWTGVRESLDDDRYDNLPHEPWPVACPFTLDELLTAPPALLEHEMGAPPA